MCLRTLLLHSAREIVLVTCAGLMIFGVSRIILGTGGKTGDFSYINDVNREIGHRPVLSPGKHIAVRGINLSAVPYSLLLVASPACHFCVRSVPFYRRLLSAARARSVRTMVAVPVVGRARSYLSSLGATVTSINWVDLDVRPDGTPLIALCDSNGLVRRTWQGALDSSSEQAVLDAIHDPSKPTLPTRRLTSGESLLGPAQLAKLRVAKQATVIDIAPRGATSAVTSVDEVRIPAEELTVRAPFELSHSRLNVLDCTAVTDAACSRAVDAMAGIGFSVAPLDRTAIDN